MKSVELLLDMHCGEYIDAPTKAKVTINEALYRRIKQLRRAVKSLKVQSIRDWDSTPEFFNGGLDENGNITDLRESDVNIETTTLDVGENDFWWHGYIKNSNESVETSMVMIRDLEECFKVLKCKKNELPLLMGTINSERAKQLLEQRLKGV